MFIIHTNLRGVRELRWVEESGPGWPDDPVWWTVMRDEDVEDWYSNFDSFLAQASGKVLISGLGLGVLLRKLLEIPEVRRVDVVEKSSDVIALVAPDFADPRVHIHEADAWTWRPGVLAPWDTAYFDCWIEPVTEEQLAEIVRLYGPYVSPGRLFYEGRDSWQCHPHWDGGQ